MSESTISPILAFGALLTVVASVVLLLAVEVRSADRLRVVMSDHGTHMMLSVAGMAMIASLYYSEVAGFVPCEFCWYQRIAMYPLAVILLVATVTRDWIGVRYTAVIAAIGLALSIYHYQMQLFPEQATTCTGAVACTARFVDEFGFVTIPFMAGCAFLSILLLHVARWRADLHLEYEDWE